MFYCLPNFCVGASRCTQTVNFFPCKLLTVDVIQGPTRSITSQHCCGKFPCQPSVSRFLSLFFKVLRVGCPSSDAWHVKRCISWCIQMWWQLRRLCFLTCFSFLHQDGNINVLCWTESVKRESTQASKSFAKREIMNVKNQEFGPDWHWWSSTFRDENWPNFPNCWLIVPSCSWLTLLTIT